MLKPLVLLRCSLFTLSFTFVPVLAAPHEAEAAPVGHRLARFLRRQVNDGSSSMMSDTTSSTATTDTMMFTALGNAAPSNTGSSSQTTVTSVFTTTMPLTTVTSTTTVTTTPGMTTTPAPASVTTVTTTQTSTFTTTVYITVTPSNTQPTSTTTNPSASTATASDCATLNTELNGSPYTAPMGDQYNLQCRSFYYTDDDNTLATYYDIASFRACADLCDQQDGCNLFFLGSAAAGDQAGECFLLSDDRYGQDTDSDIADAGVKVGYVSQQLE